MNLDVEKEVAALQRLTTGQLAERYAEVFGEQTRTRHRQYLLRKIAWRLQANSEGDLSERARRRAEELAADADVRVMPPKTVKLTVTPAVIPADPRLPVSGTAIVRPYKGRTLHVLVRDNGLEFEGRLYKSLSAVAKAVTGSHCNGFRFFGLAEAK